MGGTSVANPPASPSHSPRLPSPPPLTEVQFGPRSPSLGGVGDGGSGGGVIFKGASPGDDGGIGSPQGASTGASTKQTRRIRPGSSAEDMSAGPPLVPLPELDSAFQLQEHLKALYYTFTQPEGRSHTVAVTHDMALNLARPPAGVDRSLWLYELCRLLTQKLNTIVVAFFTDDPPCSAATCPEMRASEWQYLCAVHDPPKPCCAIDYSCHTLDWAANMLTSTKHFPSRLTLGGGSNATPAGNNNQERGDAGGSASSQQHQQGLRNLTNICRRLYRIFAHAWYQHRAVFWQVESTTGLYILFKTVCDVYQLIPEDSYTVPPEAEGVEAASNTAGAAGEGVAVGNAVPEQNRKGGNQRAPTILRKPALQPARSSSTVGFPERDDQAAGASTSLSATLGLGSTSTGSDDDNITTVSSSASTNAASHPAKAVLGPRTALASSSADVPTVPEEEEEEEEEEEDEERKGTQQETRTDKAVADDATPASASHEKEPSAQGPDLETKDESSGTAGMTPGGSAPEDAPEGAPSVKETAPTADADSSDAAAATGDTDHVLPELQDPPQKQLEPAAKDADEPVPSSSAESDTSEAEAALKTASSTTATATTSSAEAPPQASDLDLGPSPSPAPTPSSAPTSGSTSDPSPDPSPESKPNSNPESDPAPAPAPAPAASKTESSTADDKESATSKDDEQK
ncbi:MAG: hypothetical protein M1815_001539 [Lichina confinis]|nr:MAG: hypothetical protein M1815_001539 [Lichina confinis]